MTLALMLAIWATNTLLPDQLQTSVDRIARWGFLETPWLYGYLLAFTGFFPLVFGFIPRLSFYKVWKPLLLANLPVSLFFILWDAWFTARGVWGFNPAYISGFHLLGLPWEEIAFFIVIPAACTFIYWSLNAVLPREPFRAVEKPFTLLLAIALLVVGLWRWEHIYTATTFVLTSGFLFYHYLFIPRGYRGRFYLAFLVSCIPFLLVNGILTGALTEAPVVMYNPDENFGMRAGTIPVDDFVYSLLMLFANITLFEALLRRQGHPAAR